MPAAADDRDREFARGIGGADSPVIRALERIPLPIWMTDRHGHVRWINVAARALFGPVSGAHFSRLIAAERVNETRELFSRKLFGAVDTTIQNTILAAVAGQVAAELISLPLRNELGMVGVIFVARAEVVADHRRGRAVPRPNLTPRQYEVLELLSQGLSTAEIAAQLRIAPETTRNHIRMLLSELGVHSRLEAVVLAFRNDWL
jgi:DNA-binding CsgD family transcriptional regulator